VILHRGDVSLGTSCEILLPESSGVAFPTTEVPNLVQGHNLIIDAVCGKCGDWISLSGRDTSPSTMAARSHLVVHLHQAQSISSQLQGSRRVGKLDKVCVPALAYVSTWLTPRSIQIYAGTIRTVFITRFFFPSQMSHMASSIGGDRSSSKKDMYVLVLDSSTSGFIANPLDKETISSPE
jgi:hypothetical protein